MLEVLMHNLRKNEVILAMRSWASGIQMMQCFTGNQKRSAHCWLLISDASRTLEASVA